MLHGSGLALRQLCLLSTRKSYPLTVQVLHLKTTYSNASRAHDDLEALANVASTDAAAQARFLNGVVLQDPKFVIRRVEGGKFAFNKDVINIYHRALEDVGTKKKPQDRPNQSSLPYYWTMLKIINFAKKVLYFVVAPYILYVFLTGAFTKMFDSMIPQKDYEATVPTQTFEDIAGNKVAKKELQDLSVFLTEPEKFAAMGCAIPRGVLLSGPPGVGKTLLAKALAGEAGVPFFFASGSEFDQMFVGLGAKRIRGLFEAAKKAAPAIIFIDEIDTIGEKRRSFGHRATINQLLSEMDGFDRQEGVVVLAATNDFQALDDALVREGRFDNKITLIAPSSKDRFEILKVHCRNKHLHDSVDLEYLAKACVGMTGAQLATLANMAGLRAIQQDRSQIEQDDLEFARAKVLMGGVDSSLSINEEDTFKIAAHEAGHAIMEILREETTNRKIYLATLEPRGTTLGHVFGVNKEDSYSVRNDQLLAMIDIGFGGRAAEDLLYDGDQSQITTGSAADLQNISRYARILIEQNGYSAKQGFVRYSDSELKNIETNNMIQGEIKILLDERYAKVMVEMKKHKKQWERLRDYLLEYRTLTGEECRTIFNGGKPTRLPSERLPSS